MFYDGIAALAHNADISIHRATYTFKRVLSEIDASDQRERNFPSREAAEKFLHKGCGMDLEYTDNFRSAWADDYEEIAEYRERQRNGCCGYVDMMVSIGGGPVANPTNDAGVKHYTWQKPRLLIIGLNHGH